ncbi:MAG: ribose 5-phosphate isomerase B [Bacteroidia bacterium]|nr:ribose 5-phosphate isomerase B [Bacteroidia bacterium]MCC6767825.1 ribose 5-phosphate isomerase B [Bacteroidia bacterium]
MNIAIGSDHAGFAFKEDLSFFLKEIGFTSLDFGTNTPESMDYPDVAHPLALAVEKGECEKGILICGSANGVAISANKHQGIRAAVCWNKELASLARKHNNANVLCIPARFVSIETARDMVRTFLTENFEGGRHQLRVDKISCV